MKFGIKAAAALIAVLIVILSVPAAAASASTYTVTFDPAGGSGEKEPAKVPAMGGYMLPACPFIPPEGSEFKCWSVNGEEFDAGELIIVEADITVKAVWKKYIAPEDRCTVRFETNGGTVYPDRIVEKGKTVFVPADPVKTGCIFDGWYSDTRLKDKYDFNTPVTSDLILYSKWLPDPNTEAPAPPAPAQTKAVSGDKGDESQSVFNPIFIIIPLIVAAIVAVIVVVMKTSKKTGEDDEEDEEE